MLAEERSDKDIAHALRICIKTVETHRVAIMRALGTRLLADLVRYDIPQPANRSLTCSDIPWQVLGRPTRIHPSIYILSLLGRRCIYAYIFT